MMVKVKMKDTVRIGGRRLRQGKAYEVDGPTCHALTSRGLAVRTDDAKPPARRGLIDSAGARGPR